MGGGGGGVTNLNVLSFNFLFHSFLRLLRTYMPMTAKREVHRLSEYLIEGAVWSPPKHKIFSCSSSPIPCLNFEQKIGGILISIRGSQFQ